MSGSYFLTTVISREIRRCQFSFISLDRESEPCAVSAYFSKSSSCLFNFFSRKEFEKIKFVLNNAS